MTHLRSNQPNPCFPPPGMKGRECDTVWRTAPQAALRRDNEKGPTLAASWTPLPASGVQPLPFSDVQRLSNPAPVVSADFEILSAPSTGPSLVGDSQATSQAQKLFPALHVSLVN